MRLFRLYNTSLQIDIHLLRVHYESDALKGIIVPNFSNDLIAKIKNAGLTSVLY
jgi:hypothetical protein